MNAPRIQRRHVIVALYSGDVTTRITDLEEAVERAERDDRVTRRHGTKSEAMALAKEHDDLVAQADTDAVKVTVWAVDRRDWARLADDHPPREGEKQDALYGVNMKTFPDGLVPLSLLEPGAGEDYDSRVKLGQDALEEYGSLSQIHWMKLVRGVWEVNVGDDALPKYSLVSRLQERKERDSKPPQGSG